jgi:ABC-type dipeptide/oligopeptide/nickel transport system permease component
MKLIDPLIQFQSELQKIRRDIHAHPELSYEEQRTSDVVAGKLTEWGIPVVRGLGVTGVVGIISNGSSKRAIGNPIDILISPDADQIERARVIAAFGLDQPFWIQYLLFIKNALAGDMGRSFVYATPALGLILERLPATMELAVSAILIAVVVGLPLGLWAGLRPNGWAGKTIMTVSILGFSLPTFWVGLMLIMVFAVELGWLPTSGRGQTAMLFGIPFGFLTWDGLKHLLMPALNLALFNIAMISASVRPPA